jgi:hypothetical protein
LKLSHDNLLEMVSISGEVLTGWQIEQKSENEWVFWINGKTEDCCIWCKGDYWHVRGKSMDLHPWWEIWW